MESTDHQPLTADVVLGIGAHADDLDFMAAGSMAKMAAAGAEVYYLILTDGSKGSSDPDMAPAKLIEMRQQEQRAAAKVLGAKDVFFLDYEDGALEITLELKKDIVRVIRQVKPDTVFAMDPTMVYSKTRSFINHPDHRAGGQAALDAVFPLARDHLTFPDLYVAGFQPHKVKTLLLTNFDTPDYYVDISDTIDLKLAVLAEHHSQVEDMDQIGQKMRAYAASDGLRAGYDFAEAFVRLDIE
jgi:LmbE family N-acetylglucosaminyl deacetylase